MTSKEIATRIAALREQKDHIPTELTRLSEELEVALEEGAATNDIHANISRLRSEQTAIDGAIRRLQNRERDALREEIEERTSREKQQIEELRAANEPQALALADTIAAAIEKAGLADAWRVVPINGTGIDLNLLPALIRDNARGAANELVGQVTGRHFREILSLPKYQPGPDDDPREYARPMPGSREYSFMAPIEDSQGRPYR
jgi:hypothetical protein